MKNPATSLALLAAVSALGAVSVSAATVTIGVTGDASIRNGTSSNANSNGSQLILVGDAGPTTNDFLRGLFSFDLSDPQLAGATINSVTLKLFIDSATPGKDGTSANNTELIEVFQLTKGFTDTQVTWTVAATGDNWSTPGGDYNPTLLASISANPSTVTSNQEFAFVSLPEFTTVANSALTNSNMLNLFVKLGAENTTRSIFRFNAGTTTNANIAPALYRPQLIIDYTPAAIPEPSSFAALAGLGMLGFAAARRRARR